MAGQGSTRWPPNDMRGWTGQSDEGQRQANKVSGSIFALASGIFASPTELPNLMAAALTGQGCSTLLDGLY
jgi:hypothetical protein